MMALDEPSSDDIICEQEGIRFFLDPEAEDNLDGEELIVDYNDIQGFKLFTPNRILSYGLHVQ